MRQLTNELSGEDHFDYMPDFGRFSEESIMVNRDLFDVIIDSILFESFSKRL